MPPPGFFVLLSEEFGFACYFWVPRMTELALVDWWRSVKAAEPGQAPLFFNTRNLPGKRVLADMGVFQELQLRGGLWYAHAHWEDDSFLQHPDGTVILHQGHPDFAAQLDTQSPPSPEDTATELPLEAPETIVAALPVVS